MLSKEGFAITAAHAATYDPTGRGWRVLHTVIVLTSSAAVTGHVSAEESAKWRKKKWCRASSGCVQRAGSTFPPLIP